jgi:glyoxylase-like metal-dependent hydrolase (beta-lactamase superfamily II)
LRRFAAAVSGRNAMKLTVLGCAGGIGGRERLTTCLLVDDDILLDAGTGLSSLDLDALLGIDHVFLTHAHLDHVAGLALLVDATQGKRRAPLTVHAHESVIAALKAHLFNWVLWPDFGAIPSDLEPTMAWAPLAHGDSLTLGDRTLTSLPVNHARGSSAYEVCVDSAGFLFTGDMCTTPALWRHVTARPQLATVIVDCSFANAEDRLAALSMHYCPASLMEDIAPVAAAVEFLIYHLKPGHEDLIMAELQTTGGGRHFRALHCGDEFDF